MDQQLDSANNSHPHILGYRIAGILLSGSCQQNGVSGQWRSVLTYAAESYSGSDYPGYFHSLYRRILQRRDSALESFRSISMPDCRRLARLPQNINCEFFILG